MTDKKPAPSRDHFRIEYPKNFQPKFTLEKTPFDIVNLSEGGIKFVRGKAKIELVEGGPIKGTIVFHENDNINVHGTVLRIADEFIVVKFIEGVSFKKVMDEQRLIIKKFGNLKQPDK